MNALAETPLALGRQLCLAYETYAALHAARHLSFERAWSLLHALRRATSWCCWPAVNVRACTSITCWRSTPDAALAASSRDASHCDSAGRRSISMRVARSPITGACRGGCAAPRSALKGFDLEGGLSRVAPVVRARPSRAAKKMCGAARRCVAQPLPNKCLCRLLRRLLHLAQSRLSPRLRASVQLVHDWRSFRGCACRLFYRAVHYAVAKREVERGSAQGDPFAYSFAGFPTGSIEGLARRNGGRGITIRGVLICTDLSLALEG